MALARMLPTYLPYLTLLVLLLGLVWRIGHWLRAKAGPAPLFPLPASPSGVRRRLAVEICLLRGLRAGDPGLWLGAWPLHLALVLLAVGHVRAFVDFPGLWCGLGLTPATVERLAGISGGTVGGLALLAGLYLLARRGLVPRVREITRWEDVWPLLLLLAVVISGNAMRFGSRVDLAPVRAYFAALAGPHPTAPPDVPGFALHFLLAQGLLLVLPFGKLLHGPGLFFAKADLYRTERREAAADAPPAGDREGV